MDAASTVSQAASTVSHAPRVTFAASPSSVISEVGAHKKLIKKPTGRPRSGSMFMLALVGIMFGLAIMYLVTRLISMTRKMATLEKQLKQQRQIDSDKSEQQPQPLPSGRAPVPLDTLFGSNAPAAKPSLPPGIPLPKTCPIPFPKQTKAASPSTAQPAAAPQPMPAPSAVPIPQPPAVVVPAPQPITAVTPASAIQPPQPPLAPLAKCEGDVCPAMAFPFPFPSFPPGMMAMMDGMMMVMDDGRMMMMDAPDLSGDLEVDFVNLFSAIHPGQVQPTKMEAPRVEEVFDASSEPVDTPVAAVPVVASAAPVASEAASAVAPTTELQSIVDNALAPLGDVMAALENMSRGHATDESGSEQGESSSEESTPRRSTRGGRGGGGRTAPAGGRGRGRGRRAGAEK